MIFPHALGSTVPEGEKKMEAKRCDAGDLPSRALGPFCLQSPPFVEARG